MEAQHKIWCDKDEHKLYEYYADFNEWLESEEGLSLIQEYGIYNLPQPSKALFAGDKAAYDQVFEMYRTSCRDVALNELYLEEQFGDNHWFERNLERFEQLVNCLVHDNVVPFIGAGLSVAGRFPTWKDHLRQQGKTANIPSEHIENLLVEGEYEIIIAEIEAIRGREVFTQEIRDVFARTGTIPEAIWRLTELFTDTLITTNYDRLIEQAYDTGKKNAVQIINGMNALEKPESDKVTIIKLHGDIQKPAKCILSKKQYDDAYGAEALDMEKPIPKLLSYYYKNSSILFLGCSLNNDRTVQVFRAIKTQIGDEDIPQHFSIEQAPEDINELADRNAFLLNLGITAIWFEKGCFDYIESVLRLAKNELRYRSITESNTQLLTNNVNQKSFKLELELSYFLRDFVDLMPLMYWLHRRIPQSETSKYLLAMQKVFHSQSFFTEQTNVHLLDGLDHILRAFSNNPHFDGYTHQKLSVAFRDFQIYFQSLGERNYLSEKFDWNIREMMSIPSRQFESLLAVSSSESGLDYHAMRLIVALLRHGLNQQHSPKHYCELPESVNAEFGDYLSLALSSKLGILIPDRLNDMLTRDINNLCQNAWDQFDQPMKIGFFQSAKFLLLGLIPA
jgi:hypothetical protein